MISEGEKHLDDNLHSPLDHQTLVLIATNKHTEPMYYKNRNS